MKEVDYKLIGMRVREKRREMQYSQEQLGFETHLSTTYISHIETGKRKPSLGSLINISNVLNITLNELLSGNQIHNPTDYQTDIDELMQDCSLEEKRFIYELLRSSKDILRENGWTLGSQKDRNSDDIE